MHCKNNLASVQVLNDCVSLIPPCSHSMLPHVIINGAYPFDMFRQLFCRFHIAFSSCKLLPEWARKTLLTFDFPGSGWSDLKLI